jgi:NAD(P)-dependent dehydrogenase (short-subunit alcohol dehydrogenase family)
MLLWNKIAIVTGGANGIGRIYCENLAREGAKLVIADVDFEGAQSLAEEINTISGDQRAVAVAVDVTSELETEAMARTANTAFGRIDILVNNAGVYPHTPFAEITLEEWRRVLSINLDSVFLCSKAVLPVMRTQGQGKIINVATDLVWVGLSGMVHYIAAKAGILGFTRSLAREVGPHGITVNAIAPGAVIPDVPLGELAEKRVTAIINHQCIQRRLEANDLVGPLIFLASSDSDFISGQILTVDGGLTTH